MKRRYTIGKAQARAGLLFVTPSMVIFTLFVFIPLLIAFVFSFMNFDMLFNHIKFVQLRNYGRLFSDGRFWNSLVNTVYYTLGTVPLQILLSLLTAVAICRSTKVHTFFKSVYFLPAICSMTIISIVWSFLIDKDIGIYTYWFSLIGIQPIALLRDPFWAMPTIILVSIWKGFGFNMVILIAGLQGIPEPLYEAAEIDGASGFQKFLRITIPMLMPTLSFTIVNSIIASFQVFDQIFVMTRGGPLFKTETVVQYIYSAAIDSHNMAYASTIAVILFAITFVVSISTLKRMQTGESDLS